MRDAANQFVSVLGTDPFTDDIADKFFQFHALLTPAA